MNSADHRARRAGAGSLIAALCAAALGCASCRAPAAGAPGAAPARLGVVNAYCPVAGTHPVDERGGRTAAPDLTRQWRGRRIGFCCDGCPPFWDAMTDAERAERLDAALRRERTGGPPGDSTRLVPGALDLERREGPLYR